MDDIESDLDEWVQVLIQTRENANLLQSELADLLGTQQPAISAIEKGKRRPTFRMIVAWLKACGYSVQALPAKDAKVFESLYPEEYDVILKLAERLSTARDREAALEHMSSILVDFSNDRTPKKVPLLGKKFLR